VKVKLPSAFTASEPPLPKLAVLPAAWSVTAPPSEPPPKEATVAAGMPASSLASRSVAPSGTTSAVFSTVP
jgi:hypothetical protein